MIRVYRNLNDNDNTVYQLDVKTVLQAERKLDTDKVIEQYKQQGFLFQGLMNKKDGGIEDLLPYKTELTHDVYMLWFDLNTEDQKKKKIQKCYSLSALSHKKRDLFLNVPSKVLPPVADSTETETVEEG